MAEGKVKELAPTDPEGDAPSNEELLVHVYDELRRVAANYLRGERADHTLQPTALVHEAYLRLVTQDSVSWRSRDHFVTVAAQMMRRVLVDHASGVSGGRMRRRRGRYGGRCLVTHFVRERKKSPRPACLSPVGVASGP